MSRQMEHEMPLYQAGEGSEDLQRVGWELGSSAWRAARQERQAGPAVHKGPGRQGAGRRRCAPVRADSDPTQAARRPLPLRIRLGPVSRSLAARPVAAAEAACHGDA